MKVSKQHADKFAREFRASLNKAAREGVAYESFFYGTKYKVHYTVEVRYPDEDYVVNWDRDWKVGE